MIMASNYSEQVREFESGATRSTELNKPDYEGFLHPLCIQRYAEYMNKHRLQPDGKLRDSDNWQLGIPKESCIKSAYRHFIDWWKEHRGYASVDGIEDALCAVMFNANAYLLNVLKERGYKG